MIYSSLSIRLPIQPSKMAFLAPSALPNLRPRLRPQLSPLRAPPTRLPSASAAPRRPDDFSSPDPRPFFVRPDKTLDIASGAVGSLLRLGAGALVAGYRVRTDNGALVEYTTTLPDTRPALPIRVFEFEACPFCRKVREAISMLDLDVVVFPCPKGGLVYREYVREKGGKTMFPYIEDPNTGWEGYESDAIIRYLYETYGPSSGKVPSVVGSLSTFTAGLASILRRKRGYLRAGKAVPAKVPIELYGYEASPFVKLVRETLTELEIAVFMHTTARGSNTRKDMKERFGRFQVPYIIDRNTGVSMFESAEICEYLMSTYGPNAPGAVEKPEIGSMFMPGDSMDEAFRAEVPEGKSLNPEQGIDEVLEEYCEDNPETDECRVYED